MYVHRHMLAAWACKHAQTYAHVQGDQNRFPCMCVPVPYTHMYMHAHGFMHISKTQLENTCGRNCNSFKTHGCHAHTYMSQIYMQKQHTNPHTDPKDMTILHKCVFFWTRVTTEFSILPISIHTRPSVLERKIHGVHFGMYEWPTVCLSCMQVTHKRAVRARN